MGRSLYLDDERRDVNSALFMAFLSARNGEWGEAKHEFEEARAMLDALINLMAAVELGEVDPDVKEGLAHPGGRRGWLEVSDIAE